MGIEQSIGRHHRQRREHHNGFGGHNDVYLYGFGNDMFGNDSYVYGRKRPVDQPFPDFTKRL